MRRTLSLCAFTLSLAFLFQLSASGKDNKDLSKDVPKDAKPQEAPTETIVAFTVDAVSEPKPALRYLLLPDLKDVTPGNPILGYAKCFGEQYHFFHHKESIENREKWQTMPLKDLPLKDLQNYGGSALRFADAAARMETPDWQLTSAIRKEGVGLLLPDIQGLRTLAGALKVRFRAEIADKRFEPAIRTAQTMFALSRHLGEHPTLIGNLVGIAVAQVGVGPLEEMISQPGCPSLYWALTDLPNPLVETRKGMQGERMFLEPQLSLIHSDRVMDEGSLKVAVAALDKLFTLMGSKPPTGEATASEYFADRIKDAAIVEAAQKRLVDSGQSKTSVNLFSNLQVLLLDEKHAYEVVRDERSKWATSPWVHVEKSMANTQTPKILLSGLFSSGLMVIQARTRLEQRIAMLRHVEAIRLHAATNKGELPKSLGDVKVPLPVDPFSGKAFTYKVEGKKAILRGKSPRGMEKNRAYNIVYEISIR